MMRVVVNKHDNSSNKRKKSEKDYKTGDDKQKTKKSMTQHGLYGYSLDMRCLNRREYEPNGLAISPAAV